MLATKTIYYLTSIEADCNKILEKDIIHEVAFSKLQDVLFDGKVRVFFL